MTSSRGSLRVTRIAKLLVDVMWWLGIGVVVIGAVLVITWPLTTTDGLDPSTHVQVTISDERAAGLVPQRAAAAANGAGVEVIDLEDMEARIELRYLSWGAVLLGGLAALPAIAAVLFGLHLLRRFLGDVGAQRVFTAQNAARLSWIGWLLVVGGVVLPLLEFAHSLYLIREAGVLGNPVGVGVDGFPAVLPGLLVLVVAAAWRRGVELQQDHDLTV